jgi:hypothetical protein
MATLPNTTINSAITHAKNGALDKKLGHAVRSLLGSR